MCTTTRHINTPIHLSHTSNTVNSAVLVTKLQRLVNKCISVNNNNNKHTSVIGNWFSNNKTQHWISETVVITPHCWFQIALRRAHQELLSRQQQFETSAQVQPN